MTSPNAQRSIVQLVGGAPWGFRLQGGNDKPIIVSKVRRKSRAYQHLQEGDVIVSINGVECQGKSHDQAMEIVDAAEQKLTLDIKRYSEGTGSKENVAPQPIDGQSSVRQTQEQIVTQKSTFMSKSESSTSSTKKSEESLPSIGVQPKTSFSAPAVPTNPTAPAPQMVSFPPPFKYVPSPLAAPPVNPWEGIAPDEQREKHVETSSDANSFQSKTIETSKQSQGQTKSSSLKQEEVSFSHKPIEDAKPVPFAAQGQAPSQPLGSESIFKVSKFESKVVENRSMWRPTSPVFNQPLEGLGPIKDSFDSLYREPQKTPSLYHDQQLQQQIEEQQRLFAKNKVTSSNATSVSEQQSLFQTSTQSQSSEFFSASATSHAYQPSPEAEQDDMGSESLLSRRRKMFSSSSFYEEPGCIYPTVEEQVELCRKIADSLSADSNSKSKGANMFYKRVKRSHKWIHEESSDGGATTDTECEGASLQGNNHNSLAKAPYVRVSKGPPKLKLILDPREILDMQKLRSSGQIINEHNAVSPDICMDLVRDLNSPSGRGAALFAKRKQKAEEWVVDEEKVKKKMSEQQQHQQAAPLPNIGGLLPQNPRVKLIKSPWEAALESPIGSCDSAFIEVGPVFGSNYMANSIIQAAENKIARSGSPLTQQVSSYTPIAPISVDIYRPKAPRGWMGTNTENVPFKSDTVQIESSAAFVDNPQSSNVSSMPRYDEARPRPVSFHDFNSIPRSWSKNKPTKDGFKPVKAPATGF